MKKPSKKFMLLALVFAVALQGCITTAVLLTTAAISQSKSQNDDKASVNLNYSADKVYTETIDALNKRSNIRITKKDPKNHTIEAVMGNDTVLIKAISTGQDRAGLMVSAHSPDPLGTKENPAVLIEKEICKELQVECTVI